MKRLKEDFIEKVDSVVKLENKTVLEIGCGSGTRSVQLAKKVRHLTAIEPVASVLNEAIKNNSLKNIDYKVGVAEKLRFSDKSFDLVVFTLSLHHVPIKKMSKAISEAIRVTKKSGYIVFLEPTHKGNFFESEIMFDACDGDERLEKSFAYYSILNNKTYKEVTEIQDETVFKFDSVNDFILSMKPKCNKDKISSFLESSKFILRAERRINIFRV